MLPLGADLEVAAPLAGDLVEGWAADLAALVEVLVAALAVRLAAVLAWVTAIALLAAQKAPAHQQRKSDLTLSG